jgi:flagellar M-ring protein FliF
MANDLVGQLSGAVRRQPPQRRLLLLGVAVLVVAAVAGVAIWASEPNWVVLYRDVSLSEAGRMTEVLDQAGIRNKLGPDGTELMVSRDDRPKARVLLAKAQLPMSGRPGFELFEQKQDWGMTDFTQRITYQRALEGELARTIGATNGVDRAEVHLTIPEPGALRRLDRPAKAAVLLRMKAGMALAPGAVQGIVATVSNSVDRLSPENIAVTDESGRLLSAPGDDGAGSLGAAGRRMELQKSVEDYLGQKAERLLASVSGLGRPRVQIAAQLNFDQVERTIESFDPDGQVLQNEGRSETEAPADGSGGGAQTVINNSYQNSRKLEKIVSGGAGVTRLTVAVLVDQRSLDQDTTSTTPVEKRLSDIQALVKDAIGFDSTRGDRITVTAVPIEVTAIDTTRPPAPPRDVVGTAERFVRPAIGLVAMVVLLVLALRTMKAMQAGRPGVYDSAGAARPQLGTPDLPPLGPPPETVLLKNKVVEETSDRPELMAQVVRAWMSEGDRE